MASKFEEKFKAVLKSRGWTVLNCGWSDFLIHKNGSPLTAVEVKSNRDKVKPHQREVLSLLAKNGLRTVVAFEGDCHSSKLRDWKKFNAEFYDIALWNEINSKYLKYTFPDSTKGVEFDGIGVS